MISREYRRASTNFHPDKQCSEELFHQLEKARSFLADLASSWAQIEGVPSFSKYSKLCHCSKCTKLWNRMVGCKWCFGINKRHGHTVRCKAWAKFGSVTGYFFRDRPSTIPQYIMFMAHGKSEEEARQRLKSSCKLPKGPRSFVRRRQKQRGRSKKKSLPRQFKRALTFLMQPGRQGQASPCQPLQLARHCHLMLLLQMFWLPGLHHHLLVAQHQ